MRTGILIVLFILSFKMSALAQDDEERKGFRKDNLFTGGSIALSFFENGSLIGANPVFGYNLTRWADVGILVNYNLTTYKENYNDRLRQSVYGAGGFVRLFPLNFLFAQAQVEHNWIKYKYKPTSNSPEPPWELKTSANSILVGGGYATGRDPVGKGLYGYLAILFDVSKDRNSPYVDGYGRALPIIRAGFQIPLFQGGGR